MDDRRRNLAVAVLVASLLGLVLVVGPRGVPDEGDDPRRSSFLSGPQGTRALFLALQELGLPVERQLTPWQAHGPPGGIVVLAPSHPPSVEEVEALVTWIQEGGTLLLVPSPPTDPLGRALGLQVGPTAPDTLGPLERVRWEGVDASPSAHPWTEGLDAVPGFRYLFSEAEAGPHGAPEVLLRGPDGRAAVIDLQVGSGRVVAWSDAAPLDNRRLREGSAALLFARTATAAVGSEAARENAAALRFDEYHHGYRARPGPGRAILDFALDTGVGRWLLQGAVALLALLLLAGYRLGEPVPRMDTRRRSPLEHVDAVAGAYRKAGAHHTARRLLLSGLHRQVGRRTPDGAHPGPPGDPDRSVAARRLHEEWKRGGGADLVALSSAMDDYVAEVRGWNPTR